jgi:CO dehydrogenase maturation factor
MKGVIAVCGKGGAGKTTLSALISRLLLERKDLRGLIIDADPAGGLSLALGLAVKRTVNDLRKQVISATREHSQDSLNLAASIDYQLLEALSEQGNLAFLSVGRPEEEGCYCQLNTFLRESIEALTAHFDLTLIDAEAGVEQVNRRVMRRVDILLLISDPTPKGIRVAESIAKVAREAMDCEKVGLIINRARSAGEAYRAAHLSGLPYLGWIPEDEDIRHFDTSGRSFLELKNSLALESTRALLGDIFN